MEVGDISFESLAFIKPEIMWNNQHYGNFRQAIATIARGDKEGFPGPLMNQKAFKWLIQFALNRWKTFPVNVNSLWDVWKQAECSQ